MVELPSGTVTFLFSDLEGSTRLWEQHPEAMKPALARHDALLGVAVESHRGRVVKTTGDGIHAVFAVAADAVAAAVHAQTSLGAEPWAEVGPLRVRIGLHTGAAELRDGDYYGSAVNRAARLMAAAHGGQVVLSHATEELIRDGLAPDIDVVDLGAHALRDLGRPERVFEIRAPGLATGFAPLQSLDSYAGNLPLQLTRFVGREAELASIPAALESSRLVTLTGVGGVGKTRLASQVAAEVLPRFAEGAWLCELAAAEDPDAMLQVVAAALGVRTQPGASLEESIVEFLRAKQVLVVLDNCEHLLDAAGRLAEAILQECRGVRILATSREVLAVAGEQVVGLRSLSLPATSSDLNAVARSDAAELFIERAKAVRTGFAVDAANADAVAEICRRLDGIPLAIELAAARVAAMSPAEIAGLLDERFRLLTGGRRTSVERHHTLRATVDWSYSLLEPHERVVFARLGVFPGSFDTAAAQAVATGDGIEAWDILDALTSLVGKSMVVADDAAEGTTRYQLLETMRHYARERLDETAVDHPDAWRRRHAEHYAAFAEAAEPALNGPDELMWRRQVRAELDNLRAAVTWGLDSTSGVDAELAIRIIAALAYDSTRDRALGIGAWAERAHDRLASSTPGRRVAVTGAAAMGALQRGDVVTARALALESIADGVPVDCLAPLLGPIALASLDVTGGNPHEGLRALDDVEHSIGGRDPYHRANLLSVKSILRSVSGDARGARADADESVRLSRQLGNPSQLSIALTSVGYAAVDDDPDAARAALEESLELTRAGASDVNLTNGLGLLARLRGREGDARGALEALRDAIAHSFLVADNGALVGLCSFGAGILGDLDYHEAAAAFAAFVEAGVFRSQWGSEELDRVRIRARDALGDDGFDAADTRGAALSYDGAAVYALDALDRALAGLEPR